MRGQVPSPTPRRSLRCAYLEGNADRPALASAGTGHPTAARPGGTGRWPRGLAAGGSAHGDHVGRHRRRQSRCFWLTLWQLTVARQCCANPGVRAQRQRVRAPDARGADERPSAARGASRVGTELREEALAVRAPVRRGLRSRRRRSRVLLASRASHALLASHARAAPGRFLVKG